MNHLPNWYSDTVKRSSFVFWHVLEWIGHIHTVVWIIESLGISGTVAWAVAVAMRYGGAHSDWTVSAIIFIGLSALLIVPPLLYRRRSRTHAIQFIYRDQPTGHKWTLAKEKTAGVQPTLRPVPGAPLPGSVSIVPGGPYALDYELEPHEMICARVKFTAKISRNTIFYTLVRVAETGGTNFRSVWLAHVFGVGNEPPKKTSDSEWTVYTTGEDLGNGWMRFDLSLPEEILKTYGTEGLVYRDQLLTVRLRGALSISPIDLDRADKQMDNPKKGVVRISAGMLIFLSLTTVFALLAPRQPAKLATSHVPQPQSPPVSSTPENTRVALKKKIPRVREALTLRLPKGINNVTPRPVIEIEYLKVPADQYLWLRIYGADDKSSTHTYWPIGHIRSRQAHSIIHDIRYEDVVPRIWSSEGLEETDPWFMDAGKKYRLELIAVNGSDDEFLRGVYQHEWDTGNFDGVDETKHIHDLHPLMPKQTIFLTRGVAK